MALIAIEFPFSYDPMITINPDKPADEHNTASVCSFGCSAVIETRRADGAEWAVSQLFLNGTAWNPTSGHVDMVWLELSDNGAHDVYLYRAIIAHLHATCGDTIRSALISRGVQMTMDAPELQTKETV